LMSLLLRFEAPQPLPALLPLLAAVAVCDVAGADALVKWPNDVVRREEDGLSKLAGILVEGRPQDRWAVLGIGLNVTAAAAQLPADFDRRAASLGLDPEAIEPTLAALLRALGRRLAASPEQTLAAWRERDALRGRQVRWSESAGTAQTAAAGVAEGVDDAGRLLVRRENGGLATLDSGEVHLA
jgi:BirA family transcriptional regulator, biotin operon repressor / biotin---[acetyl-CoA-carboxylase] ligase